MFNGDGITTNEFLKVVMALPRIVTNDFMSCYLTAASLLRSLQD